jgi:hypothetical protein
MLCMRRMLASSTKVVPGGAALTAAWMFSPGGGPLLVNF